MAWMCGAERCNYVHKWAKANLIWIFDLGCNMVDEGLLFLLIIWLEIFKIWPCLARSENIRRRRYYIFCHMRQEVVQSDMRFYNACLMCCAVDTRNKSLLTDAIDVSCSAPHIHAIATLYKRAHCRVKLHGWQFIFMHTVKFWVIGG